MIRSEQSPHYLLPSTQGLVANRRLTGEEAIQTEDRVIERALQILSGRMARLDQTEPVTSPDVTRSYLRLRMAELEHEVFALLLLDNRHRVIRYTEMFRGTIDGASVHPREVVKEVLRHNASAVILAHNHPSGVAEPSASDETITRRLVEALRLIDVRVLDHLVVGGTEIVSFAERGLI